MEIKNGTVYEIADEIQKNFFSSGSLTIVGKTGNIIRFKLSNGKGYGAMPLQHLEYMLRNKRVVQKLNKRKFLEEVSNAKDEGEEIV
ncbi:hypothetical protein [Evansella tamaricis]|uniref:Uncharacterized protein n=1 Tax=Evansella tamaricis TaxID=2069301 RepID=A0ABS6JDP0_9BACI|nr:hypothetical protein [Evansella tamaricis]MBU9711784.1 hypothetical protein [Evansella tamaricis]